MIDFVTGNVDAILAVVVALHGLALAIVNLTPTPRDDEIVGKAYKVVEFLAGVFGRTVKELPGEREDAALS